MEDQVAKLERDVATLKTIVLGVSLFDPAKQFLPKVEVPHELNVGKVLDRINKVTQAFSHIHTDSIKQMEAKQSIQDRVNENDQIKFKFIEARLVAVAEDLTDRVAKSDLQSLKEELYYFKGQNQVIQATLATKESVTELAERVTRMERAITSKVERGENSDLLRRGLQSLENQLSGQIGQHSANYDNLMRKLENTESIIRRNQDKFEIYKENIQLLIDKIKEQRSTISEIAEKKVSQEQLQELRLQCEKYAMKVDVAELQVKVDPVFDRILKEFSSFKVQYEQYSKLISQLDYSLLLKANKMDIQIVEGGMQNLEKNLKTKQEAIDRVWEEIRKQEQLWEERLKEATETIQLFVAKLVQEEESKAINQRVMKVLEAHNVKELIKNQYKIQFMLDRKADQSQLAQIAQTKAGQKHLERLEAEHFNLSKALQITVQAISSFMEVFAVRHETPDSLNHQKSEIQKSMSILYGLQEQLTAAKKSATQKQQMHKQERTSVPTRNFPDESFYSRKRSRTQQSNYDTEEKGKVHLVSYKMLKYPKQSSAGKMLDLNSGMDFSVKLNPVLYRTQGAKSFGQQQ